MKLTYKQRIFIYFVVIFAIFAGCIIYFEQEEEKKYRTEILEAKLDGYAELIHAYIANNNLHDSTMSKVREQIDLLPKDIRVTVIANDGKVLFDKEVANVDSLGNHLDRPEIILALYQSYGSNIRKSASTKHEYIYYAKHYSDLFVRVALPYNVETKNLLKADNYFIYVVLAMFIGVLVLLNYVSTRFSKSISQLKSFTSRMKEGKPLSDSMQFPDDELGEIGHEVVDIFNQKEESKRDIEIEKEKLVKHFQFSKEGISTFASDFRNIYTNTYFIQYLNLIVDKPEFDTEALFRDEIFAPLSEFLKNKERKENNFSYQINKNGKVFHIQAIVFEDESFEVTIRDITKQEKTRLLKQEMTSNIAHELRTPVTSLRGYLETLTEQNLPEEKQKQFLSRAYQQIIRLSNLIEDVSLLSKIEEYSSKFTFERINLLQLINEVRIDLTDRMIKNNTNLFLSIPDNLSITGNYTLLYSIFRNLIDNSLNYGGENIEIHINDYMEDGDYVYLSFYDTGVGVEEHHLSRLFERFYRVGEGRTRDTGGSGLGLSIVKNAILLHQGQIQVKNRLEGGLEFLFTLKK